MSETETPHSEGRTAAEVAAAVVLSVAFAVCAACSLTRVYVEGDDAASAAYHLYGRNMSIQPIYGAYQAMADAALSLFFGSPIDEPTLHRTMLGVSALSALGFAILIVVLSIRWLDLRGRSAGAFIAVTALLAIPELLFLGLLYGPVLVAIDLVLLAHLLVRGSDRSGWRSVMAAILFGLGVSFRWTVAAYLPVILLELILTGSKPGRWRHAIRFGVWASLASAVWVSVSFLILGLSFREEFEKFATMIQRLFMWATKGSFTTQGPRAGLAMRAAWTLGGFSPVGVALMGVGIVGLIRTARGRSVLVLAFADLIVSMPFFVSGVPKFFITAFPGLLLLMLAGAQVILVGSRTLSPRAGRVGAWVLLIALAAPWVIGLRADLPDSLWGPGFVLRQPGVPPSRDEGLLQVGRGPYRFVVGSGLAMPTPEGPRPLGGYGHVLFGGLWKSLLRQMDTERTAIVDDALSRCGILIQERPNFYLWAELPRRGWTTDDPSRGRPDEGGILVRDFVSKDGRRLRLVTDKTVDEGALPTPETARSLAKRWGCDRLPVLVSHSSPLVRLARDRPGYVEPRGPFTALLVPAPDPIAPNGLRRD